MGIQSSSAEDKPLTDPLMRNKQTVTVVVVLLVRLLRHTVVMQKNGCKDGLGMSNNSRKNGRVMSKAGRNHDMDTFDTYSLTMLSLS
jgi:hypothetical protein